MSDYLGLSLRQAQHLATFCEKHRRPALEKAGRLQKSPIQLHPGNKNFRTVGRYTIPVTSNFLIAVIVKQLVLFSFEQPVVQLNHQRILI